MNNNNNLLLKTLLFGHSCMNFLDFNSKSSSIQNLTFIIHPLTLSLYFLIFKTVGREKVIYLNLQYFAFHQHDSYLLLSLPPFGEYKIKKNVYISCVAQLNITSQIYIYETCLISMANFYFGGQQSILFFKCNHFNNKHYFSNLISLLFTNFLIISFFIKLAYN